jgi:hypothetical protein
MFRPTPEKIAGLCYVTPVTVHKAYTGKEEDYIPNSELYHAIHV